MECGLRLVESAKVQLARNVLILVVMECGLRLLEKVVSMTIYAS